MSYEILEHTADVGIQARADTCERAFAEVGEGLATLLGAWDPGRGEPRDIHLEDDDREALLAAWADEILYLNEAGDLVFGGFEVSEAGDRELRARVLVAPRKGRELDGEIIKAATLHRILVEEGPEGSWIARIYLDV